MVPYVCHYHKYTFQHLLDIRKNKVLRVFFLLLYVLQTDTRVEWININLYRFVRYLCLLPWVWQGKDQSKIHRIINISPMYGLVGNLIVRTSSYYATKGDCSKLVYNSSINHELHIRIPPEISVSVGNLLSSRCCLDKERRLSKQSGIHTKRTLVWLINHYL